MAFEANDQGTKTTAARVLIDGVNVGYNCCPNYTWIEGSLDNGIDLVRTLRGLSGAFPWNPWCKICVIDEADYLTGPAQAGLRHIIEDFSKNCRFLFTANNIKKITPALRARMKQICFDISPEDRAEVIERLVTRYETKLPELGIQFDPKRLREVVGIYYPDLRPIANQIEFEFA